jgi:hypothetical protein
LEIPRITVFGTYPGAATIMRKAFDWKRSRISMLEVETVPQSCIPLVQIGLGIVLHMRSLLLVKSFDLRPSKQYTLFRVISWLFPFCENVFVPGKSPVEV